MPEDGHRDHLVAGCGSRIHGRPHGTGVGMATDLQKQVQDDQAVGRGDGFAHRSESREELLTRCQSPV